MFLNGFLMELLTDHKDLSKKYNENGKESFHFTVGQNDPIL